MCYTFILTLIIVWKFETGYLFYMISCRVIVAIYNILTAVNKVVGTINHTILWEEKAEASSYYYFF